MGVLWTASMLVSRMSKPLLLLFGLFLAGTEAAPQDLTTTGPGGEEMDCEKMYNGLWTMKEQWLSDMLPREFYSYGLQQFFGDHVDWTSLESFKISDTKLKTELVETTNEEFDHFLEWVEEKSQPPVEPYEHVQFFRAPDNVNDLWTSEVSLASDQIVHGIDKLNMILNGGVFSTESHRFWQYSSTMEKRQLGMLRQLSEMVNKASGLEMIIPEFLSMARNEGFQKSFLDELVKFGKDFATETFKAINSLEAEFNLNSVIDAVKKAFNEIDFDQTTSKVFLSFLKARSLVLGINV